MEKHTPGWTPEEQAHPEEGQSCRQPEPAGKGNEKLAKKASQTKGPVEEGPVLQKPIKYKVRRPKPEPEDFIQKIRLGTMKEEVEEELAETLERHRPKRSQEQWAKEPTPTVAKTQQRAKEPTSIAVETHERVEPRAAQSEATTEQPGLGREHACRALVVSKSS